MTFYALSSKLSRFKILQQSKTTSHIFLRNVPFEPWNLNPNGFENGRTGPESILNEGGTRNPTSKYKYCQFNLALLLPSQLFPDVSASGPNFLPIWKISFPFFISYKFNFLPFSFPLFLFLNPQTNYPLLSAWLAAICEFSLWIKVDGMGPAMRSIRKRPEIQMIKFVSSASIHKDYLNFFYLKAGQFMIMKRHVWMEYIISAKVPSPPPPPRNVTVRYLFLH
jgi:hypothetical protein